MKKIDLHIHTKKAYCDSDFTFDLAAFKRYVETAKLDAVAVTNHDLFDKEQYLLIHESLDVTVFPGIEINVEKGHVLVLASPSDVDDFAKKCSRVAEIIPSVRHNISVAELTAIFGDLSRYLLIPHCDKSPSISHEAMKELHPFISAGEVDSAKKFVRYSKDATLPTPVLFSDTRITSSMSIPVRQTFVDCGDISLTSLKSSLSDRTKVALSEQDGNELFQVFEDGQMLSTGLNVVLGSRSSGKTHLLDELSKTVERPKYIRQFSLVQQNDADDEKNFLSDVERRRGIFVNQYLLGFKNTIEAVVNVDLVADDRELDTYLETLLRFARDRQQQDIFSKAKLYAEAEFPLDDLKNLSELIKSVQQVIENINFRTVIEKHVQLDSLKSLITDLIELYRSMSLENDKKRCVNELVRDIRQSLSFKSGAILVEDVDLYEYSMNQRRVARFTEMVNDLRREETIWDDHVQAFRIVARKLPFINATELGKACTVKTSFVDAFKKYGSPYAYLQALLANKAIPRADLYKLFARVEYRILNRDGVPVSGGERSEYRLIQEISDALNYDLLLIDEPESSFDNLFLKSEVNQTLKSISKSMPVVVVTHNSTVGASARADYVLFTKKYMSSGSASYRVFSGYPTDKALVAPDGTQTDNYDAQLDALEAGSDSYTDRRQAYEAIKGG